MGVSAPEWRVFYTRVIVTYNVMDMSADLPVTVLGDVKAGRT